MLASRSSCSWEERAAYAHLEVNLEPSIRRLSSLLVFTEMSCTKRDSDRSSELAAEVSLFLRLVSIPGHLFANGSLFRFASNRPFPTSAPAPQRPMRPIKERGEP